MLLKSETPPSLCIVSSVRAYIRYADGTISKRLGNAADARWEIVDALEAEKISMRDAFELTRAVESGLLVDGDTTSMAYLHATIEERASRALKNAPMLLLVAVPMAEKKRTVVDVDPGHFHSTPDRDN